MDDSSDPAPDLPTPVASTRFAYRPGVLRIAPGCVTHLEAELSAETLERALIVCGRTVGSTPAVIEPVTAGLGDRLAGIFAETTPQKRLSTAVDGAAALAEAEADVLVSLGGGSSLDTAKLISVLAASDRSPAALRAELEATGTISVPDGPLTPIVAVPTTLAGADLSQGAGVGASPEHGYVQKSVTGGVSDPKLLPAAVFADASLVATTPPQILAGSAMNGFDKGLETLYSRRRTPVTDGTASRGLELLQQGLLGLSHDWEDPNAIEQAVEGAILVQYGISRPDGTTLSLVHAFGHGLRHHAGIQQGVAHAVVVPHVLEYLFEQVDGRRTLIANALGVPSEGRSAGAVATGVVGAVTEVRDALELPTQLRSLSAEGLEPDAFEAVAETILADRFMRNGPDGLEVTQEEIVGVLEAAW